MYWELDTSEKFRYIDIIAVIIQLRKPRLRNLDHFGKVKCSMETNNLSSK